MQSNTTGLLTLPLADTFKSWECYLLLELLVNHGKCQCYTMRPVVAVCITREHSSFQVWILPNCNTLVSAQHFLLYISNCLTHGIHMFRQPLHFQMRKIGHFLKKEVGVLGSARKCLLQYFRLSAEAKHFYFFHPAVQIFVHIQFSTRVLDSLCPKPCTRKTMQPPIFKFF